MNRFLVFAVLFCLAACESDTAKLERLEGDKLIACLVAESDARKEDSVREAIDGTADYKRWLARSDSLINELRRLGDQLHAADTRAEAALIIAKGESVKRQMEALNDNRPALQVDTGMIEAAKRKSSGLDSLLAKSQASDTKCKLATRDYERFMR